MRDTAYLYGHIAPLGQLKAGRLDLDVASASPTARPAGSPWAGMSGAAVVADSHLVGVVMVDPARYQDRLVAVPASQLLNNPEFRRRLADHGVPTEAAPVGANFKEPHAGVSSRGSLRSRRATGSGVWFLWIARNCTGLSGAREQRELDRLSRSNERLESGPKVQAGLGGPVKASGRSWSGCWLRARIRGAAVIEAPLTRQSLVQASPL